MRFTTRKRRTTPVIIIVALIDVLIVLVIFLLVTTTFKQQPALNLTLPESSSAVKSGASENPPLLVSMDKTGALLFGLDKVPLTLADLQGQLTAGADKARLEKREPKMVIMADQATPWAKIVSVMDAGAKAKIKSISAVTKANNKS